MSIEGNTSENNVKLTVTEDELAAGVVAGAVAGVSVSASLSTYACWITAWNWWGPSIACGWQQNFNFTTAFTFDVINLAWEAYKFITESKPDPQGGGIEKGEPMPIVDWEGKLIQTFAIADNQSGQLSSDYAPTGAPKDHDTMVANPTFTIPINVWAMLVNTDPAARATNEALKKIQGDMAFGVNIGAALPITVKLKEITLNNVSYTGIRSNVDDQGNCVITATSDAFPPSGAITDIGITFSESPGIDIYLGLFASLTMFKVFSVSWNWGFDLLALAHIDTNVFGSYDYAFTSNLGGTLSKACDTCGVSSGSYEVIFE